MLSHYVATRAEADPDEVLRFYDFVLLKEDFDIEGACHEMFGVGTCANLSDDLGFPIVNTYALAFARRHILGDERDAVTGVIDGSTSVSELATLQKK